MRPHPAAFEHDVVDHVDAPAMLSRAVIAGARSWSDRAAVIVLACTTVASTAVPQPAWARTHAVAPAPAPDELEASPGESPSESPDPPATDDAAGDDAARGDDAAGSDDVTGDATAEPDPPAPSRGRFRESPPPPSPEPSTQGGPEPSVEPPGGVVGGYWDLRKTAGREPPDGDDEIIAGSILVPLGTLSVASAASMVWLSAPGHCAERWQSIGATPTHDQCKGLLALSIVRVSYGSLMLITGAVLLAVGVTRRNKHRIWERGGSVGAWLDGDRRGRPTAGGLTWTWRFGASRR